MTRTEIPVPIFLPILRLKQLLKQEEEHTLQEMERRYDTTAERKKKMIALARQLRDKREKERQQYISHQLDRQFR